MCLFSPNMCIRTTLIVLAVLELTGAPTAANTFFPSVSGSAVDQGPADGQFDNFLVGLAINNNGFSEFRSAFEFDLSAIPQSAVISSAIVSFDISDSEGARTIEAHGFFGTGVLMLSSFAQDGLLGSGDFQPGNAPFVLDVTTFIAQTVSAGAFAGFGLREVPANCCNYLVMSAASQPQLDITLADIPEPPTNSQLGLGLLLLSLGRQWAIGRRARPEVFARCRRPRSPLLY
jgi:hypothetical protein